MTSVLKGRGFEVDVPAPDTCAGDAQTRMVDFVQSTPPGDTAVIYFSGHGWSFPDTGPDPDEQSDECLIFYDQPLVDDWARVHLWPRAIAGARYVVILDACHSNSALLGLRPEELRAPRRRAETPWWRLSLSACGDAETTLASDDTGGAATGALRDVLTQHPQLTYRELWPDVALWVENCFAAQGIGRPVQQFVGPDDSLLDETALIG